MRRRNEAGVALLTMVVAVAMIGLTGCQRPQFRHPPYHEPSASQPIGERPGDAAMDPVRK